MGVQLNIKDPETVRLARELAGRTGRTVTETIRAALEKAVAEREAEIEGRYQSMKAAADAFRAAMPDELRGMTSKELMDPIYNEDGSFAS